MLGSTRSPCLVLQRSPARVLVALLLGLTAVACRTPVLGGTDWDALGAVRWRLASLEDEPALADVVVTLHVEGTSRIFGEGGVNRYFGTFDHRGVDPRSAGFRPAAIASTRMAGPPAAQAQESRYLGLLDDVDDARFEDGDLVLSAEGRDLLRFEPMEPGGAPLETP